MTNVAFFVGAAGVTRYGVCLNFFRSVEVRGGGGGGGGGSLERSSDSAFSR